MNPNIHTSFFKPETVDYYLVILVILVAFLFLFSIAFALYTIYLRYRDSRLEARVGKLEAEWQPQVLDIIAGKSPPEKLLQSITERDSFLFIEYIMRYAQVLKGEEHKLIISLASHFLDGLIEKSRRADPESRAYTIKILSTIDFDRYADVMVRSLDDRAPLVGVVAAHALLKRQDLKYVRTILTRMHRFKKWSQHYLSAMLSFAGEVGAPALREALADKQLPVRTRAIAARTLLLLNDFASADIAAEVITDETDRDLVASCLRLIRSFGHGSHIRLVRRLCDSTDDVIRAQALSALGSIGDIHEAEFLTLALKDPSPWAALHAAKGLAKAGAYDILKEIAASDKPEAIIAAEVLQGDSDRD